MRLKNALIESLGGGTPGRDAVAILVAVATWLGGVGVAWELLIHHVAPMDAGALAALLACMPAALTWAGVMIITELKKWY